MTNELGDSSSVGNVPETDGTIPGCREGETRVLSQLDLTDEVRVTSHHLSGKTPLLVLIFLTLWVESPLDESSITGSGKEEFLSLTIDFLLTDSEGGDPTAMTY